MRKLIKTAAVAALLLCSVVKSSHASYDGTPSTGSFAIVTNSGLAAATASGTLTVLDTAALAGVRINVGAYTFVAGRDFSVGASTNATATNLAAAINARVGVPVSAAALAGDNHVTLTGLSAGTLYNSVGLTTSASGEISVSAATLTGGQNNAVVYVNGIALAAGINWFVADVSSNTAIGLAAGINNHPVLRTLVQAQATGTTVLLRSILTPGTYSLSSAAGAPLTASQANMSGGSQGLLTYGGCFLGPVAALPSSGYPAGCLLYLTSDPTKLYVSTQAVLGTAPAGTNSWLAK